MRCLESWSYREGRTSMRKRTIILGVLMVALGAVLGYAAAAGQFAVLLRAENEKNASASNALETTGTPGTPGATTTISGKQLPPPDPKFGGVIKDNALQSKAWWAQRIVPPKKAPNILLIMTDDSGFGVPSTYGGV